MTTTYRARYAVPIFYDGQEHVYVEAVTPYIKDGVEMEVVSQVADCHASDKVIAQIKADLLIQALQAKYEAWPEHVGVIEAVV